MQRGRSLRLPKKAVLILIKSTGIALIRNGGGRLDFPDETSVGNEKLDRDGRGTGFLFGPLIQIKPAHTLGCCTCFGKLGRSSPQDPAKIRGANGLAKLERCKVHQALNLWGQSCGSRVAMLGQAQRH
jgi:hypothetical protein